MVVLLSGFCVWLQYVLGQGGVILMLIIIFMAVTSAGSAEMMAVSSLFTYDIYKVPAVTSVKAFSVLSQNANNSLL